MSGYGQKMGVLDRMELSKGKGSLEVNVGRPIVASGDGDALFPNYFGEDFV